MPRGKKSQKDLESFQEENRRLKEQEEEQLRQQEAQDYEADLSDSEDTEDDEELSQEPQPEQPTDFKSFDTLVKEFKSNEGWVHVSLQKDRKPRVKINKFRPAEFDRDEIAKIYGGGLYYYDLRDVKGKRVAMDEQRFAENEIDLEAKNPQGQNSEGLSQALGLVDKLTEEISELKAQIAGNMNNKTNDGIIALITAMNEQNKQQQQQTMQLFTLMFQSLNKPQQEKPNTMKDTLDMIAAVKALIPEQPKEDKPSMSEALAVVNAIAEMKDTGVDTSSKSIGDVVKEFLTDGSLLNLVNSFKKKPIIQPTQNQQPTEQPISQPVMPQQPKPENRQPALPQSSQPALSQPSELEKCQAVVKDIFIKHEKSLLNLKMEGYTFEDTANTILNLGALAPELKQIFYVAFDKWQAMFDILQKSTTLFANDVDYLKGICLYIHNTFYEATETNQKVE